MYDNVSVRSTRNDEKHIKYVMKALDKIYIIYIIYRYACYTLHRKFHCQQSYFGGGP